MRENNNSVYQIYSSSVEIFFKGRKDQPDLLKSYPPFYKKGGNCKVDWVSRTFYPSKSSETRMLSTTL